QHGGERFCVPDQRSADRERARHQPDRQVRQAFGRFRLRHRAGGGGLRENVLAPPRRRSEVERRHPDRQRRRVRARHHPPRPEHRAGLRSDPIRAQVSEATWHYFGGLPPAAANTLPALTGLTVTGTAASRNPSKAIDIRNLRDESNSRPLPFATLDVTTIGQLIAAGMAAVVIAKLSEGASSTRITQAAGEMLGDKIEFFRGKREGVGLPPAGLDPIASRQLATRRSAPPLVVPLSNGLTLESVSQALPPAIDQVPQAAIVALAGPRLSAVMTARHVPTQA